ncbi:MAG: AAA family ATPase [Candidatus Binatia bacterium]
MEIGGTILWAAAEATAYRDVVEETADEFHLAVRFCAHPELFDQIRAQHWDAVCIALDGEPGRGLALLKELAGRMSRLPIIAAAPDAGIDTIRTAVEAGATDVVSLPIGREELYKALMRITRAGAEQGLRQEAGEIVTVCGSRGGLGVTTTAVNLALQLATLTRAKVALVDLDLQRGDVAAYLNLVSSGSLATVATATGDVDELFVLGVLARHPAGVFVLTAPAEIEEGDLVGPDDVGLVLKVLRSQFRYIVIDTTRTFTGASLAAFEQADRVLLLTDLSVPSIRGAKRTIDLLNRVHVSPPRVEFVVTEAREGGVSVEAAGHALGKQPVALLPRDEDATTAAMNDGTPLAATSPLFAAISTLAAKIAGVQVERRTRSQFLQRLIGLVSRGESA